MTEHPSHDIYGSDNHDFRELLALLEPEEGPSGTASKQVGSHTRLPGAKPHSIEETQSQELHQRFDTQIEEDRQEISLGMSDYQHFQEEIGFQSQAPTQEDFTDSKSGFEIIVARERDPRVIARSVTDHGIPGPVNGSIAQRMRPASSESAMAPASVQNSRSTANMFGLVSSSTLR